MPNYSPRAGNRHSLGVGQVFYAAYGRRSLGVLGLGQWSWRMVGENFEEEESKGLSSPTSGNPLHDCENVNHKGVCHL